MERSSFTWWIARRDSAVSFEHGTQLAQPVHRGLRFDELVGLYLHDIWEYGKIKANDENFQETS